MSDLKDKLDRLQQVVKPAVDKVRGISIRTYQKYPRIDAGIFGDIEERLTNTIGFTPSLIERLQKLLSEQSDESVVASENFRSLIHDLHRTADALQELLPQLDELAKDFSWKHWRVYRENHDFFKSFSEQAHAYAMELAAMLPEEARAIVREAEAKERPLYRITTEWAR